MISFDYNFLLLEVEFWNSATSSVMKIFPMKSIFCLLYAFNHDFQYWRAYSSDLNGCNYYLWGYIEDQVYVNNPQTVEELEIAIENFIFNISTHVLKAAIDNFEVRLSKVYNENSWHIEHVYHKSLLFFSFFANISLKNSE